jgi:AraC-like DNA-binding protein
VSATSLPDAGFAPRSVSTRTRLGVVANVSVSTRIQTPNTDNGVTPAGDPFRLAAHQQPNGVERLLSGGLAGWQIQRLSDFIDSHLEQTINIAHLTSIAKLSRSQLGRAFKASFGESPHFYIVQRRLRLAALLMLTSNRQLSDIAAECGFSDQAHLSRVFGIRLGKSPAAWRQEQLRQLLTHRETTRLQQ